MFMISFCRRRKQQSLRCGQALSAAMWTRRRSGVSAQAGYGGAFGHGTGHSLGLEIHETPAFAPENTHICAPGMVITVEPGIYLEGGLACALRIWCL